MIGSLLKPLIRYSSCEFVNVLFFRLCAFKEFVYYVFELYIFFVCAGLVYFANKYVFDIQPTPLYRYSAHPLVS